MQTRTLPNGIQFRPIVPVLENILKCAEKEINDEIEAADGERERLRRMLFSEYANSGGGQDEEVPIKRVGSDQSQNEIGNCSGIESEVSPKDTYIAEDKEGWRHRKCSRNKCE
ncbi:hypothetical protein J6590_015644 [Homalodisca vitripennis]|nr:hypothetical protein J6590_015644 [Homalodisca vitripennis]